MSSISSLLFVCLLVISANAHVHESERENDTKNRDVIKTKGLDGREANVGEQTPTQSVSLTAKTLADEVEKAVYAADTNGATCYDRRLSNYIDSAISTLSHDMGKLSQYILDQIVRARIPGSWLVHAEMINNQRQGLEWQSVSNGDLFAQSSTHGCYYHNTQTYILIVRY